MPRGVERHRGKTPFPSLGTFLLYLQTQCCRGNINTSLSFGGCNAAGVSMGVQVRGGGCSLVQIVQLEHKPVVLQPKPAVAVASYQDSSAGAGTHLCTGVAHILVTQDAQPSA